MKKFLSLALALTMAADSGRMRRQNGYPSRRHE